MNAHADCKEEGLLFKGMNASLNIKPFCFLKPPMIYSSESARPVHASAATGIPRTTKSKPAPTMPRIRLTRESVQRITPVITKNPLFAGSLYFFWPTITRIIIV